MRLIYCFALAACVAVSGCQSPSSDSSATTPAATADAAAVSPATPTAPIGQAVIRGRAMYYEKIKLPPGGYLVVQLTDNQLADTPKAVIAQTRLDDVAGAPYDFTLPYDPSKLRPNGQYGLHASLYGPQGDLIFTTDTRVPFTPGIEDVGEFRMKMVNGRADIAPPRSVWDEAKARGVAFRGVGNEPGWLVEVDRGDSPAMRAMLDYGERQVVVPQAQGISSTPGFGGRTADGVDVVLRIERASCSDGMSDDTYPAAIKLTVGDKTYSGCGRYLDE
ncbi:MAG: YbaY family lipoprotein [Luteimonas sp.]|nr:YbaY family lipoprotein [Luteimonas sp.]